MAAGLTLLSDARSVRGAPANEKIILGIIGVGGRGPHLARGFCKRDDYTIGAIADVKANILESRAAEIAENQMSNRLQFD